MSLFIGKVIGTKMQKTAKVEVTRLFLHPHVLKVRLYLRQETPACFRRATVHVVVHDLITHVCLKLHDIVVLIATSHQLVN